MSLQQRHMSTGGVARQARGNSFYNFSLRPRPREDVFMQQVNTEHRRWKPRCISGGGLCNSIATREMPLPQMTQRYCHKPGVAEAFNRPCGAITCKRSDAFLPWRMPVVEVLSQVQGLASPVEALRRVPAVPEP